MRDADGRVTSPGDCCWRTCCLPSSSIAAIPEADIAVVRSFRCVMLSIFWTNIEWLQSLLPDLHAQSKASDGGKHRCDPAATASGSARRLRPSTGRVDPPHCGDARLTSISISSSNSFFEDLYDAQEPCLAKRLCTRRICHFWRMCVRVWSLRSAGFHDGILRSALRHKQLVIHSP